MTEDDDIVLRTHPRGCVLAVRRTDGSCPALEFLESLTKSARNKFKSRFIFLLEAGQITNREHFHKIEAPGSPVVWEMKVSEGKGLRLYVIQHGHDWYATHGRTKPADKYVVNEAERARKIYEERRRARG